MIRFFLYGFSRPRVIFITLGIVFSQITYSQFYYNDTLWFGATSNCILTMALPTDSGIYVAGIKADKATGAFSYPLIGFIDSLGNERIIHESYDTSNEQIVYGSTYKLFTNTSGNFVLAYSNAESGLEYPRVKEINMQGQVLRDIRLDTVFDLGYKVLDITRLYQHQDSSYWLWSISSLDTSVPEAYRHAGPLLCILKPDFSVDTIIRYYFDPSMKWDYYFTDEVELDSGRTAVLIQNIFNPQGQTEDGVGVVTLLILNKKGEVLNSYTYTDNSIQGSGATSMIKSIEGNNLMILCNEENRYGDSADILFYVNKFDYTLQLLSSTFIDRINNLLVGGGYLFLGSKRIIATSDSNYLALCTGFRFGTDQQMSERIFKVSRTGEILWKRDFYYLNDPDPNVFSANYCDMLDVRECPDGGFAFPGQIMGNTFQTGWFVKTNCLGFLGPPQAAFAYKNNKMADSTFFYNTSVQAGSYHWDFGDGTSYDTDEKEDTLLHLYADTGVYYTTLIAYGCNGETDTLHFNVQAIPQKDTLFQAGEGYFSFYPNPISAGQLLYVYINGTNEKTSSTIELAFYDTTGKTVQVSSISSKAGNYIIPNTLSSGMYFVHLTQNGHNIALQKLVIK